MILFAIGVHLLLAIFRRPVAARLRRRTRDAVRRDSAADPRPCAVSYRACDGSANPLTRWQTSPCADVLLAYRAVNAGKIHHYDDMTAH
jgi:hypothetical protein